MNTLLLLLLPLTSLACPMEVTKTMHANLAGPGLGCIETYFGSRNLGQISLGESEHTGKQYLFRDTADMVFDEHFLFRLTEQTGPLEKMGRKKIAQEIFQKYLQSLKNDIGQCELQLFSAERRLGLEDFRDLERSMADQPGSRIMLTKEDVTAPSWKLICQENGQAKVEKEGKYFFLLVDVYENKSLLNTKDHLAYYLFSLR
jgi:hypothetical protein